MNVSNKRVRQIVHQGHEGQVRMDGSPYVGHPYRVAERVRRQGYSEATVQVAMMHDLVEDTHWTLEALITEGFESDIVRDIDLLTKREDEEFYEQLFGTLTPVQRDDYVRLRRSGYVSHEHALALIRAAYANPRVRAVKLADGNDNLNDTLKLIDISQPNPRHVRQLGKYSVSVTYLSAFPIVVV